MTKINLKSSLATHLGLGVLLLSFFSYAGEQPGTSFGDINKKFTLNFSSEISFYKNRVLPVVTYQKGRRLVEKEADRVTVKNGVYCDLGASDMSLKPRLIPVKPTFKILELENEIQTTQGGEKIQRVSVYFVDSAVTDVKEMERKSFFMGCFKRVEEGQLTLEDISEVLGGSVKFNPPAPGAGSSIKKVTGGNEAY